MKDEEQPDIYSFMFFFFSTGLWEDTDSGWRSAMSAVSIWELLRCSERWALSPAHDLREHRQEGWDLWNRFLWCCLWSLSARVRTALDALRFSLRIISFKFILTHFLQHFCLFAGFTSLPQTRLLLKVSVWKVSKLSHLDINSQPSFQPFPPFPPLSWFPRQDGPDGGERSVQRCRTGQQHSGSQRGGENHRVRRFCAGARLLRDGLAGNPHLQHPEEERIQLHRREGGKRCGGCHTGEGRWEQRKICLLLLSCVLQKMCKQKVEREMEKKK